jgi:FkbM family methyltransferase
MRRTGTAGARPDGGEGRDEIADAQPGPGTLRRIPTPDGRSALLISGEADDTYLSTLDLAHPSNLPTLWVAEKLAGPTASVIDVGANLGLTAVLFAGRTSGPVHALEPSPLACAHLRQTVAHNGKGNIHVHEVALGAAPGRCRFFENRRSTAASHLVAEQTLGERRFVEVDVVTLDAFVEANAVAPVGLVKIDVEGFEPDVLAGARNTIARFRPAVFLEMNAYTLIAFRDHSPRALLRTLLATFPFVYRFADGVPRRIADEDDVRVFLHDLLVLPGCVEDVCCTFDPLPGAA